MRAAYLGNTDIVVELVKAGGALLDLQNTVCPNPIIHDVQENAYSLVKLNVTGLTLHVYTCPSTYVICRVHDILIPSVPVFHFHSLHREETQL